VGRTDVGGSLDALYPALAAVLVCVLGPLASAAAKRLGKGPAEPEENDGVTLQGIFRALGEAEARAMKADALLRDRDQTIRDLRTELRLLREQK
jgi:hypothetical protein